MSAPAAHSSISERARALFDLEKVEQWLCDADRFVWPGGRLPVDIRIERGWPRRDSGFTAEWSFQLGDGPRCVLFGRSLADPDRDATTIGEAVCASPDGITGVFVPLPEHGVVVFSPDRDPDMPHLAACLDGARVAPHLAEFADRRRSDDATATRVVNVDLLGYRAGKRAAVRYDVVFSDDKPRRFVGKTYVDDRAERLVRLQRTVDEQLRTGTDERIRTSVPIGFIPELRMAIFPWNDGAACARTEPPPSNDDEPGECTLVGVDALAALHRVRLDDLPLFGCDDEMAVVTRWRDALTALGRDPEKTGDEIAAALASVASSLEERPTCTLHRDFYERQFVADGPFVTLFDLDTVARGDACLDIGNYLAHVYLTDLQLGLEFSASMTRSQRIVSRYGLSGGALGGKTLAFYWASSLFRVGAVHALRTRMQRYTIFVWRLAAALLERLGKPTSLCPLVGRRQSRLSPLSVVFRGMKR